MAMTNNFPVASPPKAKDRTASTACSAAELEAPVGKSKRRGPGQSVPNRYPGRSHGPATKNVRKAAHKTATTVELPDSATPVRGEMGTPTAEANAI